MQCVLHTCMSYARKLVAKSSLTLSFIRIAFTYEDNSIMIWRELRLITICFDELENCPVTQLKFKYSLLCKHGIFVGFPSVWWYHCIYKWVIMTSWQGFKSFVCCHDNYKRVMMTSWHGCTCLWNNRPKDNECGICCWVHQLLNK